MRWQATRRFRPKRTAVAKATTVGGRTTLLDSSTKAWDRTSVRIRQRPYTIRKPLAAHEQPIIRAYVAVEDIQTAVKHVEEYGAIVVYPPTRQGPHGTFAIVMQGGMQLGL